MKFTMNKTLVVLVSLGLLGNISAVFAEDSTVTGTPATTVELGNLDPISLGTMVLG